MMLRVILLFSGVPEWKTLSFRLLMVSWEEKLLFIAVKFLIRTPSSKIVYYQLRMLGNLANRQHRSSNQVHCYSAGRSPRHYRRFLRGR
jgi:hypothetical protein